MRATMGCSRREPMDVLVLWKLPPGKSFSNGVVPTTTPSSSTMAPEGLLVIWSLSAKIGAGQASRNKAAQRVSSEREAIRGPRREDETVFSLPQRELTSLRDLSLISGLASGLLFVTVTGENWEAGIFGETGIGEREIAEDEDGAARGFEEASVEAIGAEAGVDIFAVGNFGRGHRRRKNCPSSAKRDQTGVRLTSFLHGCHSGASVVHKTHKPARQFMDPFRLTQLDGIFGDQLSPYADRGRSRENEIGGCLLIHSSCGDQAHLWERPLQSADVTVAADLRAGKNLDEVRAGLPRSGHFSRRQSSRQNHDVFFEREFDDPEIESGAGQECSSRIQTTPGCFDIEKRARTDDQLRTVPCEIGNHFNRAGHRHGDFHDRNSAVRNRLGGKPGVLLRGQANGRDDADFLDASSHFFLLHRNRVLPPVSGRFLHLA